MGTADNIWVAISFFGLALFCVISLAVWNGFNSDTVDENIWEKTDVGIAARDSAQSAYDNLDAILVIVYFALHIGILIMAYLLRTHPIIFVVVILLTAILTLLAAPLSNAWNEAIDDDGEMESAAATLPMVDFIMDNFPKFEVIWAILTGIVLAGLARSEGFI